MEIRGDEVRLPRPAKRLERQVPLSIAGPNERRPGADLPSGLEVGMVVAHDPRAREIAAQLLGGAKKHSGLRLPALASFVGKVRTVVDAVEARSRGHEEPLEFCVDLAKHLFREVAAPYSGLVRHHDREGSLVPDRADRLDGPGKEPEPARMAHVADTLVDGAVAIEKYRRLSAHEIRASCGTRLIASSNTRSTPILSMHRWSIGQS